MNTMDDVHYDMYLEDLHNKYIDALENVANSNNLKELSSNLNRLESSASELHIDASKHKKLKAELKETATLRKIYILLTSQEQKSTKRYIVGTTLAVVGVILAIIGTVLTAIH